MAENTSSYNDTAAIRAMNHRSTELGRPEIMIDNEYEPQYAKSIQKIKSAEGPRKKSSSFQITRVVAKSGVLDHANEDGDSLDDLDETNTEDLSSDFQDISKNTDFCDQSIDEHAVVSYTKPDEPLASSFTDEASATQIKCSGVSSINSPVPAAQTTPVEHVKDKTADIQSRFKVVKIESKDPFKRGRWKCLDYLDPPTSDRPVDKADKPVDDVSGSSNSSTSSSVHYTSDVDDPGKLPQVANLAYTDGHPIVEPMPIHPGMGGCDIQIGGSEHPVQSNTNLIQGGTSRVTMTGSVQNGVSASTTMVDSGQTTQAQMTSHPDRQNIIPMATNISGQAMDIGMVDSQLYQQRNSHQQPDSQLYQQQPETQLYQQQPDSQLYQQQPETQLYQQQPDSQLYQQQPNA
ncbi:hypothetical protein LSAT2_016853, partial [Lamellibrachia satsuma]